MHRKGRSETRLLLAGLVLALLAFDFVFSLSRPLDNLIGDALLASQAAERTPAPDIVLVNIDERSLEQMAVDFGRWPWSRAVHAELLERILEQRPRAVVFDILFSEWDEAHPEGDEYFVDVASAAANVFFPIVLLPENEGPGLPLGAWGDRLGFEKTPSIKDDAELYFIPSLRPLTETGRIGLINSLEDTDGIVRRYHLAVEQHGWLIPSLPAKVALFFGAKLPDARDIQLHWTGSPQKRKQYSYVDVFRDLTRAEPSAFDNLFTDTVAIIGGNAASLYDVRATPISATHPGADILATALDNLLNQEWLRAPPLWLMALASCALLIGIFVTFRRGTGLIAGGILLGAATVCWLLATWRLLESGIRLPVMPVLAWPVMLYVMLGLHETLRERAAREQAVRTFGRFIDPRVVANLVREDSDVLTAMPQSREITVLFSDIRGFTTLSETRSPEEIVDILNRYFAKQVEVIFRHGGTIDKFIGDAIMAFWGAPVDDPAQADHAVEAALEMIQIVHEFRTELSGEGIEFDIGIGLHTGQAVVGFVGADNRLDYTAIGDTVNLASRIEGQTKGRARLLISGATRERCHLDLDFVDHGDVQVKGRAEPVRLFEPRRIQ